MILMMIGDYRR